MATVIRFHDVHENDNNSSMLTPGLRFDSDWDEQSNGYTTNASGCMRGNDTFNYNGSTSVGVFTIVKVSDPNQDSYSDFINFNYGYLHERLHKACARKKASNYYKDL